MGDKPAQPTSGERLDALIRAKASKLAEAAASGEVPADKEVAELERLERLRELVGSPGTELEFAL